MESETLTVEEVAVLLRVSEQTVYRMAREGDIPSYKVGNQWRFLRAEVMGKLAR